MSRIAYIEGAEPEGAFTEADGERARVFLADQLDLTPPGCPVCGGARIVQPMRTTFYQGDPVREPNGPPRRCESCRGKP